MSRIEWILDTNNLVFRYNEKLQTFSAIQADFLLSTLLDENDIYIFLSKNKNNTYFCRSLFPKENKDYTSGQIKYTLLYKEKIHLQTGEIEIQYKHSGFNNK